MNRCQPQDNRVHVRLWSQLVKEDEFGENGCKKVAQEDAGVLKLRSMLGQRGQTDQVEELEAQ